MPDCRVGLKMCSKCAVDQGRYEEWDTFHYGTQNACDICGRIGLCSIMPEQSTNRTNTMTKEQKLLKQTHGTPENFRQALYEAHSQGMIKSSEMTDAIEKYQIEWDRAGGVFNQTNDQSDHQLRVEELMRLAKQPIPNAPTIPDASVRTLRAKLILEEALEAVEALGIIVNTDYIHIRRDNLVFRVNPNAQLDLSEIIKECCDIAVVTTGTLSACGVKDRVPNKLVDENNLQKFGPGHSYRPDGKLIKPPNHPKPDINAEINRQLKTT